MPRLSLVCLFLLVSACSTNPAKPYRNERPVRPLPDATELLPKCKIAVQFNEDEASVPESDYLDGMFCLGLMEGITSTNRIVYSLNAKNALFCPFNPDFKVWHAAKAVVNFAALHPELLDLEESEFSVMALAHAYPCE